MVQRFITSALFVLLLFGCRGAEIAPEQSLRDAPSAVIGGVTGQALRGGKRRWTSTFAERQLLLAEEILIEGPPGLLEHVATRLDEDMHAVEVKATPDGLKQTYVVRPKFATQAEPIACFLDELEAHAMRRLTVLERPGAVPVRVVARGDVYMKDFATGEESRSSTLALEGPLDVEELPKPVGAPADNS